MIVIIDGCGSNITSIQFALERLGKNSIVSDNEKLIQQASHVILPGVGHAQSAMQNLRARGLDQLIKKLTQPVLGICLGMQLLYEYSEEGQTTCLGIIPGRIRKFIARENLYLPHMGWNRIQFNATDHFSNQTNCHDKHVYFVHSYAAPITDCTVAITEHGQRFTSIVRYKNFIGMQFHPERSGAVGEFLLKKFLTYKGKP